MDDFEKQETQLSVMVYGLGSVILVLACVIFYFMGMAE